MDIDEPDNAEKNSVASGDSKNNTRNPDSDKTKGKRKLYVGSQSLGYRRDHMEVIHRNFLFSVGSLRYFLVIRVFVSCLRCCHH